MAPAASARAVSVASFSVCAIEHHRCRSAGQAAQGLQRVEAAQHWHGPIKEDRIGHRFAAADQRVMAVDGFAAIEAKGVEHVLGNAADHVAIVDDQAVLHIAPQLGRTIRPISDQAAARSRSRSRPPGPTPRSVT